MAAKKTASNKARTDKQTGSTAKKTRGKPFEKGHKYAWKSGQSGNPAGRPKSRTLSEAYREALRQPLPGDPSRTYADAVAETLCRDAVAGNVIAAKELADRTEGRPRQAIEISIEEKKRELVNNAIAALMAEVGIERDEAVEQLKSITPEISEWVN